MKILAIDTSAVTCSVAVYDGERVTEEFVNNGLNHSRTLMVLVDSVLKKTGLSPEDIDLFACSSGPGSFTGIRIGVSAVKGMASAVNKPCASVPTLEGMAMSCANDGIVCCLMDARRGQFYNAMFEKKGNKLVRLSADNAESGEDIAARIKDRMAPVTLMGDGARVFESFAEGLNVIHLEYEEIYQRASGIVFRVLSGEIPEITANELCPVYLRPSQAEREYAQRQNK